MRERGNSTFVGILVAIVVVFVAFFAVKNWPSSTQSGTVAQGVSGTQSAPAPPGSVEISIASSNTKEAWLRDAVSAFNEASKKDKDLQVDGKPAYVVVLKEDIDGKKVDYRTGTMTKDTLEEKIKPTILSHGEESALLEFKKEWKAQKGKHAVSGDAPVLVRTPIVFGMWQSRAKAMGCWPESGPNCTWQMMRQLATNSSGWKMFSHPEWGKFKIGYGHFDESNSGKLAVISMCMAGAKKTKGLTLNEVSPQSGCGQLVAAIDKAKVHSGKSDLWLLEKMVDSGPDYLDAVVTYESNVIAFNQKHGQKMREPLVAVYPQDGTVVVQHPFAVLDGVPWVTEEQVKAAKMFGKFLLSKEMQEAMLPFGLRPTDPAAKVGSPIEQTNGANPNVKLLALEVPETLVVQRIGEIWHEVKKAVRVVLVFDRSGSMRGQKIVAATKGAQEFVRRMGNQDYIVWMPFDNNVYTGLVRGTKSQVGEKLIESIGGMTAEGGTALYDAVLAALADNEEPRKHFGESIRYAIVVLSDGDDRDSKKRLSDVEARLKPNEYNPNADQVHTICIGSDCDEKVLKTIAAAANGRYWKGNTEKDMLKIYKEIAAHY